MDADRVDSFDIDHERNLMFERMTAKIDALIAEVAAWNPTRTIGQDRYPVTARHPESPKRNLKGPRSP